MATARATSNKATCRRIHHAVNIGDADLITKTIDGVFEPDALIGTPAPVRGTGAQAMKEMFSMLRLAFPDLHVTVDDMIEERDKVVCRNTVTGTHRGEYMGVSPTGQSVRYNEIFIFRFVGGRVVETWGGVDVLSQMKQLGLIQA